MTEWSLFRNDSGLLPRSLPGFPGQARDGAGRSVVCDDAGAWARCAGRVPQLWRLAIERGPRIAYGLVQADGVAADLHASAARLSQARRQGPVRARARHSRCGLSGAVGAESSAVGASLDARLRRLR